MNEFCATYRGYKIESHKYFKDIFTITRPSGKPLMLTSKLGFALGYIDQDIKSLLAV